MSPALKTERRCETPLHRSGKDRTTRAEALSRDHSAEPRVGEETWRIEIGPGFW